MPRFYKGRETKSQKVKKMTSDTPIEFYVPFPLCSIDTVGLADTLLRYWRCHLPIESLPIDSCALYTNCGSRSARTAFSSSRPQLPAGGREGLGKRGGWSFPAPGPMASNKNDMLNTRTVSGSVNLSRGEFASRHVTPFLAANPFNREVAESGQSDQDLSTRF